MANLKIVVSAVSKGLGVVVGKFKSMASGIAGSFKSVMSSPFGMLLGGGSAIGAARGLVGFISKLDGIGKAAKRVGISAEAFQKLSFAARRSGAGVEQLEMAFKQMSVVITDAASGSAAANGFLTKLGVTLDQLSGKSPEQQFEVLADALAKVEDHTEKAYLAQRIFSEGGLKLLPMIANYRALGDEIKRMGGIIENETIAAAERAADSIQNLKVRAAATAGRSGIIEGADEAMRSMDKYLARVDRSGKPAVGKFIGKAISPLVGLIDALWADPNIDNSDPATQKQIEAFRRSKKARIDTAKKGNVNAAASLGITPNSVDSLRAIGANAAGTAGATDVTSKLDRQIAILEAINSSLENPDYTGIALAMGRNRTLTRTVNGAKE